MLFRPEFLISSEICVIYFLFWAKYVSFDFFSYSSRCMVPYLTYVLNICKIVILSELLFRHIELIFFACPEPFIPDFPYFTFYFIFLFCLYNVFLTIFLEVPVRCELALVLSCLNLLDRCDKPLSILKSAWTSLKPEGKEGSPVTPPPLSSPFPFKIPCTVAPLLLLRWVIFWSFLNSDLQTKNLLWEKKIQFVTWNQFQSMICRYR